MKIQPATKAVIAIIFALLAGSIFLTGCVERSIAGSVNITSEPSGAEIWIDNSSTEKVTPAIIYDLKEGNHTYVLRKGYVISNGTFYVKDGQTTNISKILPLLINETNVIIRGRIIENPPNYQFSKP